MKEILNRMEEGKAIQTIQDQKLLSSRKLVFTLEHEDVLNNLFAEIKPIDFYEKADLLPSERLSKQNVVVIAIDAILEFAYLNNWFLRAEKEKVSIYNGAYWKELEREEIKHFLTKAAELLGYDTLKVRYHQFAEDLMKQFLVSSYSPKKLKVKDQILINFQNGTLVINAKGEYLFKDFDPSDLLYYQLGFCFDANAKTDLFDKFLDRVLVDKADQMILAEYAGYIFIKTKTLKLEKSLILYGTGANGKSTFFEILYALLGHENITTFSLQSLTNETGYQRAQIQNKLLNYASEISVKMDSTVFKQLSSGEPVEVRLPYGNPYIIEDYAKLIFNTNELPRDVEHNPAFFRRFIILGFDQTIPEGERDPELAKKIIESELPGILNWIIFGMQRLIAQKGFTFSEKANKAIEDYKNQSNTVALMVTEMGNQPGFDKMIPLKQYYQAYKEFCLDYGHKPVGYMKFVDRIRRLGFELTRKSNYNYLNYKLV